MKKNTRRQIRILFISRAFPPIVGGIEKQNSEIFKKLRKRENVTLVSNRYGKRFLPLFLPYAIAYAFCHAQRYDLVLLGDGILSIVAWWLRLFRCRPLTFCILHGLDITFPNFFFQKLWVRRFLPKVDVLFPVSRQTAVEAISRGLKANRCRVIPNGVNPDEFNRAYNPDKVKSLLGRDIGSKFIVLTVGRLVERKGVHWFVENVMPKLKDNVVYVIAGEGPMRKRIEKSILQHSLNSRIFLLGGVNDEDLRTLYAAADIFVLPNIPVENDVEGFGLVVLEAGAAGLPVITSRIEGLTDAISEGDNGQLLKPGCVGEYVAHIHALLGDTVARREKGQRARAYVRRHFPWEIIVERYLVIFREYAGKIDG